MSVDQFLLSSDTTDLNYPEIRPTLDLNFARVKALDPRITFTRSSGGSYVGADGILKYAGVNEARFDHNPVTGESLGLLIEESRQNLTTYSEQLDNARWGNTGFTLSTNTIETTAPDGTNNAEKILETFASSIHIFYSFNAYSITAGTVYTASIFIKSINKQFVQLIFDDNATVNGGYVNFNLSSGTITASANYGTGTSISGTITQFSNGWYRISITSTAGTTSTLGRFSVNGITSGSSGRFPGYVGNTSNGYYIWGAQLEVGAFPTSYIPTTASTVTRSADNAQMLGTNFSSWYNQSEGTLYTESNSNNLASGGTIFIASNSSYSERYAQLALSGNVGYGYGVVYFTNSRVIGGGSFTLVGDTYANGAYKKIAVSSIAANFNGVSTNQVIVNSKENLYPSGIIQARIGSYNSVTSFLNGTIKRLTYWPKRLPNAQLQALTR